MKHYAKILAVGMMLIAPSLASASTWNIDPDHSSVGFSIKHLMVSNVKGSFDKFSGAVDLDDKNIAASKVSATIDAASIDTRVQKRDDHLRSPDFFDVAKYPNITFVSKQWSRGAKGAMKVAGDLTMHGVTRKVVLNVAPFSKETRDPWGNTRRGTTATATINRKDFGIDWNKSLDTGGLMIGDQVDITLEIEMILAKAG
jgi:polyisoprenoid-binding protein YceI